MKLTLESEDMETICLLVTFLSEHGFHVKSRTDFTLLQRCGENAGHLFAGASYFACVLPKGHKPSIHQDAIDGHVRGGNCFRHGEYVGKHCPEWPKCGEPAVPTERK